MTAQTSKKPLLLLDVDGPLNPYRAKPDRRPEGYATHRLAGFQVWLNPAHGPLLMAFAAEYGVELAWATTWEHEANISIGPNIGLPKLPVVDLGWQRKFSGTIRTDNWKFDGVLAFANGRPLAWLDDDFAHFRVERDWFESERVDVPTLLHHIDPAIGLTSADLEAVAVWLGSLGRATTAA